MCNKYAPPKVTHDSAFVQEQRNPFSTCWHSVFFNWFFSKLIESRPKKSSHLMPYVHHTYWRLSVSWLAQLRYIFVEAKEYLTSVFSVFAAWISKTPLHVNVLKLPIGLIGGLLERHHDFRFCGSAHAVHSTPLPFYWVVQDWSIYTDRLKAMPFSHALLLVLKVCSRSQQRIPKSQAVSPSYPPSTILTCCFKMYCTHIVLHTASCSAAPVVSSYTT